MFTSQMWGTITTITATNTSTSISNSSVTVVAKVLALLLLGAVLVETKGLVTFIITFTKSIIKAVGTAFRYCC